MMCMSPPPTQITGAMINRSEVIITTRGEAQFQLLLPTALPGTINLLIHLLDMETQVEQDIVSDQSFTNADQVGLKYAYSRRTPIN